MGLITSIAAVTTGVVATGATLAGAHATTTSTPQADAPTIACGAVWDRLPDALQDDLAALRGLSPAERTKAVRAIRKDALAGEYGDRVQSIAERRVGHRAEVWKRLPADLRHDLREARQADPADRAAAVDEIRTNALAGEYGDRVQTIAERLADRRDACGTA
ncbi:hypothetical protein [Nocardioides mangrovi]|uniref:Spy/CpxP family protein refolding chaperone n=1 Tax=Nocardioides mangrovi TaxID=2874580 RepID=A0ABS7UE68_9ACTN|nr:hypothetical protein [Nocardioides mangrovi]MBZ5739115.1 hypothetical protein [Nocardioides mangrovi]